MKIEEMVEDFQPSIIYTHNFGDLNVDHQITHKAVMTACRPQPDFCVKEIYSFEVLSATHWQSPSMGNAFIPNYFVDVSGFMDNKIKALQCYDGEMRDPPHARSYKSVENLAKFRGNIVGVKSAEAFFIERIVK
jgi:LmbE family N-acetylglucosaminyl deacetylase